MVDRIKHDAPVLVIGLGRFGAATAGQLDRLDREVLAIDADAGLVQKWAERVTHRAAMLCEASPSTSRSAQRSGCSSISSPCSSWR